MLVDEQIQKELAQLPQNLKIEVLDFVLFLQSKQPKKAKKPRQAGTMPNLVKYMADDFDAPLDDLKEYM
ncbi:MAG: DUF2281 domain-containing protein [Microscillaceae bacterium]|jgi:hypothetical protein|nr:DUF2281 domain-containing protein [Microscillaceae bacterium]